MMIGNAGTVIPSKLRGDFGQFGAVPAIKSRVYTGSPKETMLLPSRLQSGWLGNQFSKHEAKWKKDTQYSSSLSEKFLHDSYARIIGMGWPAVHLVLRSLEGEPDDWFYALRAMTGADPVKASDVGQIDKMANAWLAWGKKRRLI
jgi:hypothetical protein